MYSYFEVLGFWIFSGYFGMYIFSRVEDLLKLIEERILVVEKMVIVLG